MTNSKAYETRHSEHESMELYARAGPLSSGHFTPPKTSVPPAEQMNRGQRTKMTNRSKPNETRAQCQSAHVRFHPALLRFKRQEKFNGRLRVVFTYRESPKSTRDWSFQPCCLCRPRVRQLEPAVSHFICVGTESREQNSRADQSHADQTGRQIRYAGVKKSHRQSQQRSRQYAKYSTEQMQLEQLKSSRVVGVDS